jgi:hypothetical protein
VRTTRIILLAVAVLGTAGAASAGVKTFDPQSSTSGLWNTPGDWSPSGVPTEADRAVIPSGKTCLVAGTDGVADTIEVSGTLNIAAGRKLTLDNDNDNVAGTPDNSVVNDEVVLEWASGGSTLKFDENDHEVTGSGRIEGRHTDCKIQIAAGTTLTNQLSATGEGVRHILTIEGLSGNPNGTYFNSGLTEAERGIIVLASTTILDDDAGATWGLRCFGIMEFHRTAVDLVGNFTNFSDSDHGVFDFYQSVQTCGTFTRNYGGITIHSNKFFRYYLFAGGQSGCGNPGSPTDADPACPGLNVQLYEVTATEIPCVTCPDS